MAMTSSHLPLPSLLRSVCPGRVQSQVELIELLEEEGRAVALQARAALRRPLYMNAHLRPRWKTIAAYAATNGADVVVLDASGLGFFRKRGTLVKLWRLSPKPIPMLH